MKDINSQDKSGKAAETKQPRSTLPKSLQSPPAKVCDAKEIGKLSSVFEEERVREYYEHLAQGNASRHLVARQLTDTSDPESVSKKDAHLHILFTSIAKDLGETKKNQLAEVVEIINQKRKESVTDIAKERDYYKQLLEKNDIPAKPYCLPVKKKEYKNLELPTSGTLMKRYLVGKNSILQNLPTPEISVSEDCSAHVHIPEVFRLYYPYEPLRNRWVGPKTTKDCGPTGSDNYVTEYWESRRAAKLVKEMTEELYPDPEYKDLPEKLMIVEWGDGADPNGQNKGQRGSVHVTSVSLLSDLSRNNPRNTFPISIGRGGNESMDRQRNFIAGLKELQKPTKVFDGTTVKRIQTCLFACIHDRPDRSEDMGVGSHNGDLTKRWGFICEVNPKIASCKSCNSRRLENPEETHESSSCSDCFDWSFEKVTYKPAKDFPNEEMPPLMNELPCFRLDCGEMVRAAKLCTERVREKNGT